MIVGILCILFIATGSSTVLAENANTRTDTFGNTYTNYGDGTSANSRTDTFGNTYTNYSDGMSKKKATTNIYGY